jgi:uncharacterized membrane protein YqjE
VDEPRPDASPDQGVLGALRRLTGNAVALLHTRLELLITEIEEERSRLVRILVLSVIAAFFLSIGVLTLTIFIILLAWEKHGLLVAGALATLYLAIGIALAFCVRNLAKTRSMLFSSSLAELKKDHDELIS